MSYPIRSFALAALFVAASAPAYADSLQDEFVARLSARDHRNSQGERLESAAAIIRQDRANFHKFNRADDEDESDSFFGSVKNRAIMEKMLERGSATPSALRAILNGTPLVHVQIFTDGESGADYVNVTVISD